MRAALLSVLLLACSDDPEIEITSPDSSDHLFVGADVVLEAEGHHLEDAERIELVIDNGVTFADDTFPSKSCTSCTFTVIIPAGSVSPGNHEIRLNTMIGFASALATTTITLDFVAP